jgi:hypothetical protein
MEGFDAAHMQTWSWPDGFVKRFYASSGELDSEINSQEAHRTVPNDATVMPERNTDPVAFDGATKEGRGHWTTISLFASSRATTHAVFLTASSTRGTISRCSSMEVPNIILISTLL